MREYFIHATILADSDIEALTMAGEIASAACHPVVICLESVDVEVGVDGALFAVADDDDEDDGCCGCDCACDCDGDYDVSIDGCGECDCDMAILDEIDDDDSDIIDE